MIAHDDLYRGLMTGADGTPHGVEEPSLCTLSACISDEDIYKMKCNECQRLVHYKCTRLPTYQLQQFLTKGYRNFVCVKCVEVPEYLLQIAPSEQRPASCLGKIVTELTEKLQKQSKENNCRKADVLQMTSKQQQQLCGGNQRYEEELQKKTI